MSTQSSADWSRVSVFGRIKEERHSSSSTRRVSPASPQTRDRRRRICRRREKCDFGSLRRLRGRYFGCANRRAARSSSEGWREWWFLGEPLRVTPHRTQVGLWTPFYGSQKLTKVRGVIRKRVQPLMRRIGSGANCPPASNNVARRRAQDLPALTEEYGGPAARPGATSDITYVLPHAQLATFEHTRGKHQFGGARQGTVPVPAQGLQLRHRGPVCGRGLHVATGIVRRGDPHERPRPNRSTTCSSSGCREA